MANKVVEMNPSKFGATKVGGRTVLTPKESLTYQNCQEVEDSFNECIKQNKNVIILDCQALSFFDSEALELLVKMHDELKKRGGSVKLIGLNAVCRDILLATRLINVLHVYKDIHEAMKKGS